MYYATSFPATENPISESSNWNNGLAVGLDWSNVRTSPNQAYGTQTGADGYNDSFALLAGTWGADQTCTGIVKTINQQNGAIYEEVEFRLRSTVGAHSSTGYEVLFSCRSGGVYVEIVKWNGAFGSFTSLAINSSPPILNNGDTVSASIIGTTITAYINGSSIVSVTDSTYSSGNPGIGFYLQGGSSALNTDYGFTSFTASDGLGGGSQYQSRVRSGRKRRFAVSV